MAKAKKKATKAFKFLEDVGTRNGAIRYQKGNVYDDLTKQQIDNYLKNNLICQH